MLVLLARVFLVKLSSYFVGGVPLGGGGVGGLQFVCASEFTLGSFPVPLKPELHARVRFTGDRFRPITRLVVRAGHIAFRRQIIRSQPQVTINNPGIRQRIISIELNRVAKMSNRPLNPAPRIVAPVMPTLKIRLIRFTIFGISSRD